MTLPGRPGLAGGYGIQAGGDQFDYIASVEHAGASVGGATTANRAHFGLVRVGRPITITKISVYITAQSGNIDVGLYQYDGTTMTRLSSSGSTPAGAVNAVQALSLSAAVTVQPGVNYYLAFAPDNATVAVARFTSVSGALSALGNRVLQRDSSFPLPASASTSIIGSFYLPVLIGTLT